MQDTQQTTSLNFSQALDALHKDHRITRPSWAVDGKWAILINMGECELEGYKYFNATGCAPFFMRRGADGLLHVWVPDTEELFATDWIVK